MLRKIVWGIIVGGVMLYAQGSKCGNDMVYVDGVCLSTQTHSSSSSSSSVGQNGIWNAANALAGKSVKVEGYFAFYGKANSKDPANAYKWIYLTSDGSFLAKLEGMDPDTGYLRWSDLSGAFKSFSLSPDKSNIVIGAFSKDLCEHAPFPLVCE